MSVLILELKLYCGPDKFYGRSKFGQYDEVNDRAPLCFRAVKIDKMFKDDLPYFVLKCDNLQ